MVVYKEYGHKGDTVLMQEVALDGVLYFIDMEGVVYTKTDGLPKVKDKDIIKAVKKAAK